MKQKNSCIREEADNLQINRGKNTLTQVASQLDYVSHTLALVGNTARLQILYLLHQEKRLCVCDLSDMLEMTISAVSQHLRKLKDRQFLDTERQGQTIYYFLTQEHETLLLPLFQFIASSNEEIK
ncbi:ArsR/SmtB family transcription factor [Myroides odoratus]|uniref:Helix-turn-helix transcriptional regulator n=1 Tax=Myroides odoratus TaxID=256 RepID=A0A9Q7E6P2_MYROD|nr:metalloregulator ArsR/SmtB family transcription factor [Myroides odoratus]EHQ41012.1 transcriptional regulator, ArsR family [Myroides odoratus DSM 2801]EKB08356.1 hypothetical protein HMPREF9716_01175 [Myroides odoratus CIP 103059]QQT98470.1 helix-turn-helix transcriptional regulator [Myroides odoratus]WQD59361.1 metalloregulator ArsR/SmtB family transcription factor [Myroides odoratus]STZ32046.1 Cadmium efflux system accessory protein [Myroides odoratus]